MGRVIINCDLGEDEGDLQTEALLGYVDAANIACGVHAGNEAKTAKTLQSALSKGLMIGAHPGLAVSGGRGEILPDADAFAGLVKEQLGRFLDHADRCEAWVSYVKLHGSLYHLVEQSEPHAAAYIELLQNYASGFAVFALAAGSFQKKAKDAGLKVWQEGFADRAYRRDGSLLPRTDPGAVLKHEEAFDRFKLWKETGEMKTVDGTSVPLPLDTICVHGDSPDSETLLARMRELLSA